MSALLLYHFVSVDPNDQKKTACFDIDVEVDDPLKAQMTSFLSSTTNQQEITTLEMKVCVQGRKRHHVNYFPPNLKLLAYSF